MVWTRLAFASFGIIMPVLSVILSVFMLGLSMGAWLGGRWIGRWTEKTGVSAIEFYALAELMIGLGAFVVPKLFAGGEKLLMWAGETNSSGYLLLSAIVLGCSILPWCVFMGTTFPLVMAYLREEHGGEAGNFSFLYLANVLGAMSGTLLTAVVLVEMFGFHHTLQIAASGNFTIAAIALGLGRKRPAQAPAELAEPEDQVLRTLPQRDGWSSFLRKWILFSTGFCAMAMEVVWVRAFSPVLKTQVYSFALIVFTYLGATFAGSWWYRRHFKRQSPFRTATLIMVLLITAWLPGVICDPRIVHMDWLATIFLVDATVVLGSIVPFCAALGYLTPGLIDDYAGGDPRLAGEAYALNVLGCILGPLFACYVLLPWMSERCALMILGLPFLGFYLIVWTSLSVRQRVVSGLAASGLTVYLLFFATSFQDLVAHESERTEVRRDYAASVISAQAGEGRKLLLVNGIGMTKLTPITKFMVHLPLAFHQGPPQSALIICFGMGTTYRSALSWNIDTTAVELVPSVTKAFGFYHADAAKILKNPQGHIVIDDGRRFLSRTREKFDVIVIDPPPPVQAAGSSLLYSTEFYGLAKQHLNPHGILQAWLPGGGRLTAQAIVRSVYCSFPHVRCFGSADGWGIHLLASLDPIENISPKQLAARLPVGASNDLLEWSDSRDLPSYLDRVISREIPVETLLNPNPEIQITDDDPLNEYFLLRDAGLF
jgi:predicted membrane-bound spermidine synthase